MICDVCGDSVEIWFDHDRDNYVRHVFLSHSDDAERIRIIQNYLDRYV